MVESRAMAKVAKLDMKIAEVELQADGKKATFFYTADQRVDFRELIKLYATEFRLKVEMKQIGARQESGKVGGIGSCGRELCCSTWLTDFKSVNTSAARYQNLSINQTKLSGQCGRLKCCLNYELDTYMDALKIFPTDAESIETTQGRAFLQKRDIFKNLMWYSYSGSNKQYPMTIERVKEITVLNKQGIKPEELQAVEIEATRSKPSVKVDMGFVNDVGQITLKTLERNSRSKRNKGGGKPQQAEGGQKKATAESTPREGRQRQGRGGQSNNIGRQHPQEGAIPQQRGRGSGEKSQPQQSEPPVQDGSAGDKPQQQQKQQGGRSQRAQRSHRDNSNALKEQNRNSQQPGTGSLPQPQRSRNIQRPKTPPQKTGGDGDGTGSAA
jgi:hypothetical protein